MEQPEQFNSKDLLEFDRDTGEVTQVGKSLSEKASEGVQKPDYWRNAHNDSLISNVGPEFMAAFMAVQKDVGGVMENDSSGYGYKYTSLAAAVARVLKSMHEQSLALQQYPGKIHGLSGSSKTLISEIHTRITHVHTGQHQIAISPIPLEPFSYPEKDDKGKKTGKTIFTDVVNAQSFGSSFTYGKRYALLSYWGIATADNDAVSALLDEPEYEKIATPVINGMKTCRTLQELKEWGEKNRAMVHNIMHPRASRLVAAAYKELQEQLPETLPEDESQDHQHDLEDAINKETA